MNSKGVWTQKGIITIACSSGGFVLLIIAIVICVVVYRTREKQLAIVDVIKEYDHAKS